MNMRDGEVLVELRDEPELLALADALGEALRLRTRRRRVPLVAVVAILAVGLLALAAVSPFDRAGHRTIVERALAAVGDGPVLHVVVRQTQARDYELVDLATGVRTTPSTITEREIWYDGDRAMQHTVVREDGAVAGDLLETPDGSFSLNGVVYTCAWIAAHPVEATKARVSCNADMQNGTTPRKIPEQPPFIDPALGGFTSGYRDALASGQANLIGTGTVDGRAVSWLSFTVAGQEEHVAVDRETSRPLVVRTLTDGRVTSTADVLSIETVGREAADFSRPEKQVSHDPVASEGVGHEPITIDDARALLGGDVLWLGATFDGLPLASVERRDFVWSYARDSGISPQHGSAVELVYGDVVNGRPHGRFVAVDLAGRPEYDWPPGIDPPAGSMATVVDQSGLLRRDGLYVTVRASGSDLLAAARALTPAAP